MRERGPLLSVRVSQVLLVGPENGSWDLSELGSCFFFFFAIFLSFFPCYPQLWLCVPLMSAAAPRSSVLSPAGLQQLILAGGLAPLLLCSGASIPLLGWIYHVMVSLSLHIKMFLFFTDGEGGLHAEGHCLCPCLMIYIQFFFVSAFIRLKLQPNSLSQLVMSLLQQLEYSMKLGLTPPGLSPCAGYGAHAAAEEQTPWGSQA